MNCKNLIFLSNELDTKNKILKNLYTNQINFSCIELIQMAKTPAVILFESGVFAAIKNYQYSSSGMKL